MCQITHRRAFVQYQQRWAQWHEVLESFMSRCGGLRRMKHVKVIGIFIPSTVMSQTVYQCTRPVSIFLHLVEQTCSSLSSLHPNLLTLKCFCNPGGLVINLTAIQLRKHLVTANMWNPWRKSFYLPTQNVPDGELNGLKKEKNKQKYRFILLGYCKKKREKKSTTTNFAAAQRRFWKPHMISFFLINTPKALVSVTGCGERRVRKEGKVARRRRSVNIRRRWLGVGVGGIFCCFCGQMPCLTNACPSTRAETWECCYLVGKEGGSCG